MTPFIDIHSHFDSPERDVFTIKNLLQTEWENGFITEGGYYSTGLHPWFLTDDNFENDFNKLIQLVENQNIIAIGECGLDRLKGASLDFQIQAFEKQIILAESLEKPVIIHCVRAFNEIISVKKRLKPKTPLIVHGFDQNEQILTDLLKNDFYISLGEKILRGASNSVNALLRTPVHRLFFETDDKRISIKHLYQVSSDILKTDINSLKSRVYENFNIIFRTKSHIT
jgi:TatD DNase family protein